MSALVITVADQEVKALMEKLRSRVSKPSIRIYLRSQARPFLQGRMQQRFQNEGDELTGKWAPLRPTTAMIRANAGYGAQRPINIRSGELFKFVMDGKVTAEALTFPGRTGTKNQQSKLQVAQRGGFGSSASQGAIGPRRPAPPRPVLAFGEADRTVIMTSLMEWVTKA